MYRLNSKRVILSSLTALSMSFLFSLTAFAQEEADRFSHLIIPDENSVQILTLEDGSTILGRITEIRAREIVFKSDIGDLSIDRAKISDIVLVSASSIRHGSHWFENPNSTRLFFGPTARMLKKGRGYFSDYYIFFPGIAVGITDNLNIGGGMSLFPRMDLLDQVYYIAPKVGVKASRYSNLAAGALIIALPREDNESRTVGVLYGVGTFGGVDASLTTGLGYGVVDNHIADKPMFMIGGEKRLSSRVSFVTENWILPGVDWPIISYGLRFMGPSSSFDLALISVLGKGEPLPVLPYVDFVINF